MFEIAVIKSATAIDGFGHIPKILVTVHVESQEHQTDKDYEKKLLK